MPYPSRHTWTVAEVVTAANMNNVGDALDYLNGAVAPHFTINMAGCWPSTTSGCTFPGRIEMATNKQNINPAGFATAVKTYAEIDHPLPGDYGGGVVTAIFIWTANSTSTNSVVWGLQGRAYADNDAIDAVWGTAVEVTDANGSAAYTQRISAATGSITIAGTPSAGQMVRWRIYRLGSGADNLAVQALLESVRITYTRT